MFVLTGDSHCTGQLLIYLVMLIMVSYSQLIASLHGHFKTSEAMLHILLLKHTVLLICIENV